METGSWRNLWLPRVLRDICQTRCSLCYASVTLWLHYTTSLQNSSLWQTLVADWAVVLAYWNCWRKVSYHMKNVSEGMSYMLLYFTHTLLEAYLMQSIMYYSLKDSKVHLNLHLWPTVVWYYFIFNVLICLMLLTK